MLVLSVFSHLGYKSLPHYLIPNPIKKFLVDELISHKQIVQETLKKLTNRNSMTVTHTQKNHTVFLANCPGKIC